MASGLLSVSNGETHEQFIQRAGRVFPADHVRSWSRIERLVFNHLLGSMIHKYNYSAITDAMLRQCRDNMAEIVLRLNSH